MQTPVESQPKDGGRFWLFLMLLVSLVYLMSNIQKTAIPGCLFDILQADFSARPSQIAALTSVLMIVYAVMQLLLGPLSARFEPLQYPACGKASRYLSCTANMARDNSETRYPPL